MIMIQQKMDFRTGIKKEAFNVILKRDEPSKIKRQNEAAPGGRMKEGNISVSAFCTKLSSAGINIGRNQMFKLLRDNGYVSRQKGTWNMPIQKHVRDGLLAVKETFVLIADEQVPRYSPLITPKGRVHLIEKLTQRSIERENKKTV